MRIEDSFDMSPEGLDMMGEDGKPAKKRRKRTRFRKMSERLTNVYENRDLALREKDYALSDLNVRAKCC